MDTSQLYKSERVVFSNEILKSQAQYYGAYAGHTFVVNRVCRGGHYELRCEDDATLKVKGAVHGGDLVRLEEPKRTADDTRSYEETFELLSDALRARAEQSALAIATAHGATTKVWLDDAGGVEYAWRVELSEKDQSDLKPIAVAFALADPEERGEDVPEGHYAVTVEVTGDEGVYLGSTETEYTTDVELLKQQIQEVPDRSILAALSDAPRKENKRGAARGQSVL